MDLKKSVAQNCRDFWSVQLTIYEIYILSSCSSNTLRLEIKQLNNGSPKIICILEDNSIDEL